MEFDRIMMQFERLLCTAVNNHNRSSKSPHTQVKYNFSLLLYVVFPISCACSQVDRRIVYKHAKWLKRRGFAQRCVFGVLFLRIYPLDTSLRNPNNRPVNINFRKVENVEWLKNGKRQMTNTPEGVTKSNRLEFIVNSLRPPVVKNNSLF